MTAFRWPVDKINQEIRNELPRCKDSLTIQDGFRVYHDWKCRCCFCGINLTVAWKNVSNSFTFEFYIPLKLCKKVTLDNIVPVCLTCKNEKKHVRSPREDIPDVNTFADLVEVLIRSVFLETQHLKDSHPDLPALREKIRRLKQLLNLKLEDIAQNMRYNPFKDWVPEKWEMVSEENNIPAAIEKMAIKVEKDEEPKEEKKNITDIVKQTLATKKYKVVKRGH